jgi:hypothetical protein
MVSGVRRGCMRGSVTRLAPAATSPAGRGLHCPSHHWRWRPKLRPHWQTWIDGLDTKGCGADCPWARMGRNRGQCDDRRRQSAAALSVTADLSPTSGSSAMVLTSAFQGDQEGRVHEGAAWWSLVQWTGRAARGSSSMLCTPVCIECAPVRPPWASHERTVKQGGRWNSWQFGAYGSDPLEPDLCQDGVPVPAGRCGAVHAGFSRGSTDGVCGGRKVPLTCSRKPEGRASSRRASLGAGHPSGWPARCEMRGNGLPLPADPSPGRTETNGCSTSGSAGAAEPRLHSLNPPRAGHRERSAVIHGSRTGSLGQSVASLLKSAEECETRAVRSRLAIGWSTSRASVDADRLS